MHPDFVAAIDALYDAFASYERPPWFLGCACCFDGEEVVDDPFDVTAPDRVRVVPPGRAEPLRTIPATELEDFAFDVPVTGGDLALFKHYVPRLLEIACTTDAGPGPEIVLPHLNQCDRWTTWPTIEREAVDGLLPAWWRDVLSTPVDLDARPADGRVDRTLCAIGLTVPEIGPFLAAWLAFAEPWSARHLRAFIACNPHALTGRLDEVFWPGDHPEQRANHDAIVEWLGAPATFDAVIAAIDHARTPDEAAALEECALRWLG